MQEKMLLIGGSGFLGLNWQYYNDRYDIIPTYNNYLPNLKAKWINFRYDGTNIAELTELIVATRPHVILNCAALTNVDLCEKNRTLSQTLNTVLGGDLAILAKKISSKFVHISTDHYQSKISLPRKESDELFPVNVYGETKMEAEHLILRENPKSLIIRVNFFGHGKLQNPSLLDQILLKLNVGEKFCGYTDIFFNPVSIKALVMSVNKLISKDQTGIFHIASKDVISKFEFARKVSKIFNFDQDLIVEGSSDDFKDRIIRPKYLALDSTKFKVLTGIKNLSTENMLLELKHDIIWRKKLEDLHV